MGCSCAAGRGMGRRLSSECQKLDCSWNAQVWTHTEAWRYSKPIIYFSVILAFPLQTLDHIQFHRQRWLQLWPSHSLSHPRWEGVSLQGEDDGFNSTSSNLKKTLNSMDSRLIFFFLSLLLEVSVLATTNQKLACKQKCSVCRICQEIALQMETFWKDLLIRLPGIYRTQRMSMCVAMSCLQEKSLVSASLSVKFHHRHVTEKNWPASGNRRL